ncbi:MAG: VCBS repeat-containing protein [Myxococcales bacterium]|nr:VCBS repeat-containing protein [Myxococcales bacterium]
MWWFTASLMGCGPAAPETDSASATSTEPSWVPISEQEVVISLVGGHRLWPLASGTQLADVDRDGHTDLLLGVEGPTGLRQAIVRGPLTPTVVPADAWTAHNAEVTELFVHDLDGDGRTDLLARHDPGGSSWNTPPATHYAITEAYDGAAEPDDSWTPVSPSFPELLTDTDGDGIADLVMVVVEEDSGVEEIRVTRGPLSRFDGPHDLAIGPLCSDRPYGFPPMPRDWGIVPDLDGDGAAELWMTSYGWSLGNSMCGAFAVSLDGTTTIDPFEGPPWSVEAVQQATPIGDWTQDGRPEVAHGLWLWVSPAEPDAAGWTGATRLPFPPGVLSLQPLPVDVSGDGRTDALGWRSDSVEVVPSDFEGFANLEPAVRFEVDDSEQILPYVEQGKLVALVVSPLTATVRRIELGRP